MTWRDERKTTNGRGKSTIKAYVCAGKRRTILDSLSLVLQVRYRLRILCLFTDWKKKRQVNKLINQLEISAPNDYWHFGCFKLRIYFLWVFRWEFQWAKPREMLIFVMKDARAGLTLLPLFRLTHAYSQDWPKCLDYRWSLDPIKYTQMHAVFFLLESKRRKLWEIICIFFWFIPLTIWNACVHTWISR